MPSGHPDWQPPRPAAGQTVRLVGANPAAGAQWTFTVTAGEVWRPVALIAVLTSDATVIDRLVRLRFLRGVGVLCDFPVSWLQTANQLFGYTWYRGAGASWSAGPAAGQFSGATSMVDMTLVGGDSITTIVLGMQAGDDWGSPILVYELAA